MLKRIAPVLSLLLVVGAVSLLAVNGAFGGVERTGTAEVPTTRRTIVISLLDVPPAPKEGAAGEETSPTGAAGEDAPGEGPTDGAADTTGTAEEGAEAADTTGTAAGTAGDGETTGVTGEGANTLSAEGQIHVVAEGETPWSIAQQYGVSVEELLAVNGIEDPTTIQIGEELKVP